MRLPSLSVNKPSIKSFNGGGKVRSIMGNTNVKPKGLCGY